MTLREQFAALVGTECVEDSVSKEILVFSDPTDIDSVGTAEYLNARADEVVRLELYVSPQRAARIIQIVCGRQCEDVGVVAEAAEECPEVGQVAAEITTEAP